jgi:hypothetical protein
MGDAVGFEANVGQADNPFPLTPALGLADRNVGVTRKIS